MAFLLGATSQTLLLPLQAQTKDLGYLAERVSKDLEGAKLKTAMVFAFSGPEKDSTELGLRLADELALALGTSKNPIRIVDRSAIDSLMRQHQFEPYQARQLGVACWLAEQAGASALIAGHFEIRPGSIDILVRAFMVKEVREVSRHRETLPLSAEWKILAQNFRSAPPEAASDLRTSVPATEPHVPEARKAAEFPSCANCPPPHYTDEARKAKLSCRVLLRAIISREGLTQRIQIVKPCPHGLTAKAVEVVMKWTFKPATGPDGKPIAVWTPIEVNFRYEKN